MAKMFTPRTPVAHTKTGELTPFGPRRACDGAYLVELFAATGHTSAELKGALAIFETLEIAGIVSKDYDWLRNGLSLSLTTGGPELRHKQDVIASAAFAKQEAERAFA
jgi:hypothetical protein